MPCYGGPVSDYEESVQYVANLKKNIERLEAALCGIMTIDPTIVDKVDWKEVGITKRQHMNWWKEHQEKDAKRKEKEEQARLEAERKREREIKELKAKASKLGFELTARRKYTGD